MATHQPWTGRVVVTGGAGFVGRAVVAAFVGRGNEVTVVDRERTPTRRSAASSATSPTQGCSADALDGADVAGVVHLAAITSVLRSVEHPVGRVPGNVAVTQDLLEGCRQAGVERFVLASTNAVVGDVGNATITRTCRWPR